MGSGWNWCIFLQCKYQNKPHSSPWFSAACAAAIIHRNHFLCLYQQNNSSESKVMFTQASKCCKRVFEAAELTYANKTKEFIISQTPGCRDLWQIANSVLQKKTNLLYFLYLTTWRCCFLYLIKQNCLLKTFINTITLKTQVSLYLLSLLKGILQQNIEHFLKKSI